MRTECLLRDMYEHWSVFISSFDYLKITDEVNKEFETFCGTSEWSTEVTGAKVVITFHSDNKNQGKGFLIHFSAIRLKGMCRNALFTFYLDI